MTAAVEADIGAAAAAAVGEEEAVVVEAGFVGAPKVDCNWCC